MKKTKLKHVLAIVLFCMVMSIGFVCLADEQATVNVKSATIRESADPNSKKLGSVQNGKTIDVIGQTTGTDGKTWYQVYVDGDTKGYIRSDLLKLKDGASLKNVDAGAPAQNANTTPTTATPVEAKKATVVNNNVRIRTGASTNHDSVGTANRGMVVTVTGEANGADGKKWYQVSFTYNNSEKTGFIRSDLVTFDNVPPDVAQSQITGVENSGEGETGEAGTEELPPETEAQEVPPAPEPQENKKEVTPMATDEEPYVMSGFTLFDLVDGGEKYTAYKNGSFYIIYGQRQDGEIGWFLFDQEKGTYTRYPYTTSGVEMSDKKMVSIVVVIALIVVIVVLVTVIGLLLIKLKENGAYERGYEWEDDENPDDAIEDLEELGLDDEEYMAPRPHGARQGRPQSGPRLQKGSAQQRKGAPPEQPQPKRPQSGPRPVGGEQPQVRRPQPTGGQPQSGSRPVGGGQPQGRRPQPQGGPRPVGGGQPQGGPRPAGGGQPQGRRPQPQGGSPQGRRPQPQNEKVPPQKGLKAKNLLDEDDDMDFMDI